MSKTLFEVVNCHILVAIEHNKVVSVALVVAEKEILAVLRTVVVPIIARNVDCRGLWVVIMGVFHSKSV